MLSVGLVKFNAIKFKAKDKPTENKSNEIKPDEIIVKKKSNREKLEDVSTAIGKLQERNQQKYDEITRQREKDNGWDNEEKKAIFDEQEKQLDEHYRNKWIYLKMRKDHLNIRIYNEDLAVLHAEQEALEKSPSKKIKVLINEYKKEKADLAEKYRLYMSKTSERKLFEGKDEDLDNTYAKKFIATDKVFGKKWSDILERKRALEREFQKKMQ